MCRTKLCRAGVLLAACLLTCPAAAQTVSPVEQAARSGLPQLTEFLLHPGDAPYSFAFRPGSDGPHRMIAAWGTVIGIVMAVQVEGREPIIQRGNPVTVDFDATRGRLCTVVLRGDGDLPVATVGVLHGGQKATTPTPTAPQAPVPGVPLPVPPPTASLTEDFEAGAEEGWVMIGDAKIATAGNSQALTTSGFAFGLPKLDNLGDIALRFRYRHGQGLGDIALRVKGLSPPEHLYHVMVSTDGVAVVREAQQKPQELARKPFPLVVGTWYAMGVTVQGGRVHVEIDGQPLIDATDPAPLPAGLIGFGCLSGSGFAYDDIALSLPSPGTAGPPGEPQPPIQTGPAVVLPSPAIATQGAPSLAALDASLVAPLQKAGIADAETLVQRVLTRDGLMSLGQASGADPVSLLRLASRVELARVLGERSVTQSHLALLETADIDQPGDIAAYAGREADLADLLTARAAAFGMDAPLAQEVSTWVQAASQSGQRLPSGLSLLPDAAVVAPRPFRAGEIGEGLSAETLSAVELGTGGLEGPEGLSQDEIQALIVQYQTLFMVQQKIGAGQAFELARTLVANMVVIKAGRSETHKEFAATEGGLYRADIRLQRPGGDIKLAWAIDKPVVSYAMVNPPTTMAAPVALKAVNALATPIISGYAPIMQGDEKTTGECIDERDSFYLYFYLKSTDIPPVGKLRLRLIVQENVDDKPAKVLQPGDPDYHPNQPPPEKPDPTISGTVTVSRQPARLVDFGKPFDAALISPSPNVTIYPVQSFRTPLYTPPGGAGERAFRLTSKIIPRPNPYQQFTLEYYPAKGQTKPPAANEGILFYPAVLRDGIPLDGVTRHINGVTYYDHAPPGGVGNGVHEMILGSDARLLMTTGHPIRRDASKPLMPELAINVAMELEGGKVETWYVAELRKLEVGGQSEPDDDSDDDGTGEFRILATSVLANAGPETGAGIWDSDHADLPAWAAVRRSLAPQMIPTDPASRRTVYFPNAVLGAWTEAQIEQFDTLTIGLGVMEDDSQTWWQKLQESLAPFILFIKTAISTGKAMWAAYNLDVGGAVSNYSDAIRTVTTADSGFEGVDDFIGAPCMTTGRDWFWQWGIMEDDPTQVFSLKAPSDTNKLTTSPVSWRDTISNKSGIAGFVTSHGGGTPNWAGGEIRMRKVAAPYSYGWVDSVQFTVSDDKPYQNSHGTVYASVPPGASGLSGACEAGSEWDKWQKAGMFMPDQPVYWLRVPMQDWKTQIQNWGLRPSAYTQWQIQLWEALPCLPNTPIGDLAFTFYHEDFWRNCGKTLDFTKSLGWKASFGKTGELHYGDYELYRPSMYLDRVKFRVHVYIWDGR